MVHLRVPLPDLVGINLHLPSWDGGDLFVII